MRVAVLTLALLGGATPLWAAAARVGTPVMANREASAGTTLTTSAGTFTTGNLIVVSTGTYSPGTEDISAVTDSAGNTYVAGTACEDAGNNRMRAFYALNITGGSLTFTVTPSASVSYLAIVAEEYSGVNAVDVEVPCTTGTGFTMTSGAFTTTAAGLVSVGGISANSSATLTQGTNFTTRSVDWFNGRGDTEDWITGSAQVATTASFAQDVNQNWMIAGWSFKLVTDGPSALLLGVGR